MINRDGTIVYNPQDIVDIYKPHVFFIRCQNQLLGVAARDTDCTVFVNQYRPGLWLLECYIPLVEDPISKLGNTTENEVILVLVENIGAMSPELLRSLGKKAVSRENSTEMDGSVVEFIKLRKLFPLLDTV